MNQFLFGIKREYWEYKRLLVIMPMIVTGIFCLMAIVATFSHHVEDSFLSEMDDSIKIDISVDGEELSVDEPNKKSTGLKPDGEPDSEPDGQNGQREESQLLNTESQPLNTESQPLNTKSDVKSEAGGKTEDETFWYVGAYLAAAWLAALFYSLSSLYNDRRDKSILYWKTMPVSDLTTVLSKYCFAILGFGIVAIAISWVSGVVLMTYANIALPADMVARDSAGMNFSMMVIWPTAVLLLALVWCAPVFALVLFVSARAKKMPFLMLVVPIIVVRIIERILFSTDYVFGFLNAHSPFTLLETYAQVDTVGQYLHTFLIDSFGSLLLGLVVAAILIYSAAWHRQHRFEL